MMSSRLLRLALSSLALLALAPAASAIPGMDSMFGKTGVFVPGQDVIRVRPVNGDLDVDYIIRSTMPPGLDGDAIVTTSTSHYEHGPPLFFIDPANSKLMLFVNSTALLHVNVMNGTNHHERYQLYDGDGEPIKLKPNQIPLKLSFSKKPSGIRGIMWSYIGTLLQIELPTKKEGKQTNHGVFFQCNIANGKAYVPGIFTSFDTSVVPNGCNVVTLHSMTAPDHKATQHKEL